jgi:SAM-dependent methyltransferase
MHNSARANGKIFFDTYADTSREITVVDIGSKDVSPDGKGSLKPFVPSNAKYIGLDFDPGLNVDLVTTSPYSFPLDSESVDIIVTSSCFEHSAFFWLTFNEIMRVLKPSGLAYINAPSNGPFHRHPEDCYRFYPDAGRALQAWAQHSGYKNALMIESYTSLQDGDMWNDFVAIFIKDQNYINLYPKRILRQIKNFTNGTMFDHPVFINPNYWPEDKALILEKTTPPHPHVLQEMRNATGLL